MEEKYQYIIFGIIIILLIIIIITIAIVSIVKSKRTPCNPPDKSSPAKKKNYKRINNNNHVYDYGTPRSEIEDAGDILFTTNLLSAIPNSDYAMNESMYVENEGKVHAMNTALLLKGGRGYYMPSEDKWGFTNTISIAKMANMGTFHLTKSGIYFSGDSNIKISTNFIEGKEIVKLFVFQNNLYCLCGGKIHHGFNAARLAVVIKSNSLATDDIWSLVDNIRGRDIIGEEIFDIDVGMGQNPVHFTKEVKQQIQSLAICTKKGECLIYNGNNWRSIEIDPRGLISASTVTSISKIPSKIRLGYDDQELHFYGRTVKFINNHKIIYEMDNISDVIIDPNYPGDAVYVITKTRKLEHYIIGSTKSIIIDIDPSLLIRSHDLCWVVGSGSYYVNV